MIDYEKKRKLNGLKIQIESSIKSNAEIFLLVEQIKKQGCGSVSGSSKFGQCGSRSLTIKIKSPNFSKHIFS